MHRPCNDTLLLLTRCVSPLAIAVVFCITGCSPSESSTEAAAQLPTAVPSLAPEEPEGASPTVVVTPSQTKASADAANVPARAESPTISSSGESTPMSADPETMTLDGAIAAVQRSFPEVAKFEVRLTPGPFDSDRVFASDEGDHWRVTFFHGTGDCTAGCIDNYYWYYTVQKTGAVTKVGEFSRVFDSSNNAYIESGERLWDTP